LNFAALTDVEFILFLNFSLLSMSQKEPLVCHLSNSLYQANSVICVVAVIQFNVFISNQDSILANSALTNCKEILFQSVSNSQTNNYAFTILS